MYIVGLRQRLFTALSTPAGACLAGIHRIFLDCMNVNENVFGFLDVKDEKDILQNLRHSNNSWGIYLETKPPWDSGLEKRKFTSCTVYEYMYWMNLKNKCSTQFNEWVPSFQIGAECDFVFITYYLWHAICKTIKSLLVTIKNRTLRNDQGTSLLQICFHFKICFWKADFIQIFLTIYYL